MRRTADPKVQRFAQIDVLGRCDDRELRRIASVADEVEVRDGTSLMGQDRKGDHCYLVLEGRVEVQIAGRRVAELGPGEMVGELSLLDRGPRSATVVTRGNVRLAAISARNFESLLADLPGFRSGVLRQVGERFRRLDQLAATG